MPIEHCRSPPDPQAVYQRIREWYVREYWSGNDGSNIFRLNGFPEFPASVYNFFCEQVTRNGKVLDLGCGNGLMLRYLTERSPFSLIPYGVDWLDASIRQAQKIILPQFADHFSVGNLVNYPFPHAPYDFIFCSPEDLLTRDRAIFLNKLLDSCAADGRVIFYCYRDVLKDEQITWVGDFHELSSLSLRRKDRSEVSLAIFEKNS